MKIIAEIGWNHMGDMSIAKKMIDQAKNNGADICKFQTWSEQNLKPGAWDQDGRRDIYKKAQLTKEQHIELKEYCEKKGVKFLTSIFNEKDLIFLSELSSEMIKIPSHEIYNINLIDKCLQKFKKVLISTGASKWSEIEKIIKLQNKNYVLMHCVSTYPCDETKVNFPRLKKLKSVANEIGYSGHYNGIEDAIIAFTLGATYVEKHFTIDKDLPGRDNKFAIMPDELKKLSDFRSKIESMSIDRGLDLQDCEMDTYNNYRGRWAKN